MPRILGVKFRDTGRVYYFDPEEEAFRYHDHVIVDTSRGPEYGTVVISPTDIAEDRAPAEIRKVIRRATADDDAHLAELQEKEKDAYRICKEKIAEHGLEMKLIKAEYAFDNSKLLFYFTADGRIDFRELVKDLAGVFRTRIELRQIGVRDETKLLGGMGSCGRPLCCHTWLTEFAPVSIKMAKDQNLSLNPSKISGCCGRLMCCLKNEADTYAYLNKGMPGKGDYATTPDGKHGDVHSVDILRQKVRVIVELDNDEKELQEFDAKDITFIPKSKKPKKDSGQKQNGQKAGKDQSAKKNPDEGDGGSGQAGAEAAGSPDGEKRNRRERPRRFSREERPERAGKSGTAERGERSEGAERREKPERQGRGGRSGREERSRRQEAAAGAPDKLEEGTVRKEAPAGDPDRKPRRRRRRRRNPNAGEGAPVSPAEREK